MRTSLLTEISKLLSKTDPGKVLNDLSESRERDGIVKSVCGKFADCLILGKSKDPSVYCIYSKLAQEGYTELRIWILDVKS